MEIKMKASELFIKMVVNSQNSFASEDQNFIKRIAENHGIIKADEEKMLKDISMSNEYIRMSIIKMIIVTLIDLDIVEKDVDILDVNKSNALISAAMDVWENAKTNKK